MYSITTTLNSTFGTTGRKATADKITGKVVGKLRLSLKREEWISCCHAKYVYESLNIFSFLIDFSPHVELKFIGTELPVPFLSFGYLYLGILSGTDVKYIWNNSYIWTAVVDQSEEWSSQ